MNSITIPVETKDDSGHLKTNLYSKNIINRIRKEWFRGSLDIDIKLEIINDELTMPIEIIGMYNIKLEINKKIELPIKVWVIRLNESIHCSSCHSDKTNEIKCQIKDLWECKSCGNVFRPQNLYGNANLAAMFLDHKTYRG